MTEGFCYMAFPCEENKKKKKNSTFLILRQPGFEPTTIEKMAKPDVKVASALVPTSRTCPGFSSLGGTRGKYIFEVKLIFIAKDFLMLEGL